MNCSRCFHDFNTCFLTRQLNKELYSDSDSFPLFVGHGLPHFVLMRGEKAIAWWTASRVCNWRSVERKKGLWACSFGLSDYETTADAEIICLQTISNFPNTYELRHHTALSLRMRPCCRLILIILKVKLNYWGRLSQLRVITLWSYLAASQLTYFKLTFF